MRDKNSAESTPPPGLSPDERPGSGLDKTADHRGSGPAMRSHVQRPSSTHPSDLVPLSLKHKHKLKVPFKHTHTRDQLLEYIIFRKGRRCPLYCSSSNRNSFNAVKLEVKLDNSQTCMVSLRHFYLRRLHGT